MAFLHIFRKGGKSSKFIELKRKRKRKMKFMNLKELKSDIFYTSSYLNTIYLKRKMNNKILPGTVATLITQLGSGYNFQYLKPHACCNDGAVGDIFVRPICQVKNKEK